MRLICDATALAHLGQLLSRHAGVASLMPNRRSTQAEGSARSYPVAIGLFAEGRVPGRSKTATAISGARRRKVLLVNGWAEKVVHQFVEESKRQLKITPNKQLPLRCRIGTLWTFPLRRLSKCSNILFVLHFNTFVQATALLDKCF